MHRLLGDVGEGGAARVRSQQEVMDPTGPNDTRVSTETHLHHHTHSHSRVTPCQVTLPTRHNLVALDVSKGAEGDMQVLAVNEVRSERMGCGRPRIGCQPEGL